MAFAQATLPTAAAPPPFTANVFALSFIQSTSSDWAQGPQNFIAAKASVRKIDFDSIGALRLKNIFMIDLGVRQTNDSADAPRVRTGENEMFGETRITYPFGWAMDPYISANFRTAITESFRYEDLPIRTADLWDPVVSFESLGLQILRIMPSGMLSARGGIALKQTRARDNTLLTDNPFTSIIETYKAESGMEFIGEASLVMDSTMNYSGRLDLFSTFLQPDVWSVRWENELRYRVWGIVGLTFTLQIIYDASQIAALQYKQGMMISFFVE